MWFSKETCNPDFPNGTEFSFVAYTIPSVKNKNSSPEFTSIEIESKIAGKPKIPITPQRVSVL